MNLTLIVCTTDTETVVTWESDPNRSLITPVSGTYIENDTWR